MAGHIPNWPMATVKRAKRAIVYFILTAVCLFVVEYFEAGRRDRRSAGDEQVFVNVYNEVKKGWWVGRKMR